MQTVEPKCRQWNPNADSGTQTQTVEPKCRQWNPKADSGTQRQTVEPKGREWNPKAYSGTQRQTVEPNCRQWNPKADSGGVNRKNSMSYRRDAVGEEEGDNEVQVRRPQADEEQVKLIRMEQEIVHTIIVKISHNS
ncbi:hypothetical protein VZT92_021663 [Zoarces viviparus]|uniref:Uncharacterized protein n=1 Tax=Zoarces viviparus TaxID=48416 RepID=A0AAW1E8Q2_ZOAVI